MRRPALVIACWLAGLAMATGPSWAGNPRKQQLNQIEHLLNSGDLPEAERLLTPLVTASSEHPRVLQLRAELLFLQGRYVQALELVNVVLRKAPAISRLKAFRLQLTATLKAVEGFIEHRSADGKIQIWTPPGKDELLAFFAIETLVATQKALREAFGYELKGTLRVEVYSSPEVLAQVSPLTVQDIQRTGAIALSKYNRLMIVTPRALLRGYPWRDTLAHEFVHRAISQLTHENTPVWLQEGLAKFFEAAWRLPLETPPPLTPAQEHLLAEAVHNRHLLTWEQMHPSMAKLPSQRDTALAFAQVQTAVEFIVRQEGLTGLHRLLQTLSEGRSDWQAIQTVMTLDRDHFNAAWKKYLHGLNLHRWAGLVPPELQFGRPLSEEQRIAGIKEARARKFLQLADLLRARGLTRAAIIEYQKARAQLGPRDELVANHLARAYLEISSPAQAISALMPVLEYYPEFPGPQVTIGVAYLRSGDLVSAEQHLKAALRLNPFDPEIHCSLARTLKSGTSPEAARHLAICQALN
jgi:tetratricopeptide (TPR) repeat protein